MRNTETIYFNEIPGVGGSIGMVVLNRPKALNALDRDMCQRFMDRLQSWQHNPNIKAVVVQSEHGQAFSAGGDIRCAHAWGKTTPERARDFFRIEYQLNATIQQFSKPYIAFIDGIAMGGGLGIAMHGSHRVVTEHALLAMPETAIGFFPDVGGTYFLSRLPGELGTYLGLTGARLRAADALYARLATHFISSNHLPRVIDALASIPFPGDAYRTVDDVLSRFRLSEGLAPLSKHRLLIDRCFAEKTVEKMLSRLSEHRMSDEWADATYQLLLARSPTSLKVTLQALRNGKHRGLRDCLSMEYQLMQHFLESPDFYEGVRAVLVDKDHHAKWQPATLEAVSEEDVAGFFVRTADVLFTR